MAPQELDVDDLRQRVAARGWYHTIDLGHGVVTKGLSENVLPESCWPDVTGKQVLDIGAWDGYISFTAERRGAGRVVALDHYVWGIDYAKRQAYWEECKAKGVLPDHGRDATDFWQPELPGKAGFDLAHEVLGSKVEAVVGDFASMDLGPLGTFDVVFYLGVLYHMQEPLTCLQRLRRVTTEVAVIETEAMEVRGLESQPLATFVAGDEIGYDFGNWWVPNMAGLRSLARAAGFSHTEVCQPAPADLFTPRLAQPGPAGGPARPWDNLPSARELADLLRAARRRLRPPVPPPPPPVPATAHYRATIRAYP